MTEKGISKVGKNIVARFYRNGEEQYTSFPIEDYGGENGAREAAKKHLSSLEKDFPKKPRATGLNIVDNNWLGYYYWNVTYRIGKKLHSKKFKYYPEVEGSRAEALVLAQNFKDSLHT